MKESAELENKQKAKLNLDGALEAITSTEAQEIPIGQALADGFRAAFTSRLIDDFLAKRRLTSQQPQYKKSNFIKVSTTQVIDRFLAAKRASGLSEASIQSYGDTLRVFAKYHPILPTTPEEIETYLARFKPDKPTARDAFVVIRLMYKWAADRLDVPNPMLKVAKPRFRAKTPDRLSATQARTLLDAIRTDRERALVYCFLGLGLRLSEAQRLDVGDIGEDIILIHGKERTEPMPLIPR